MSPPPEQVPAQPEKRRDFILGIVFFVVLNAILGALSFVPVWLAERFQTANELFAYLIIAFYALPWLVNPAVVLYFLVKRRHVAFGMLAAFGVLLLCVLLAGLIFAGVCFIMLGQPK